MKTSYLFLFIIALFFFCYGACFCQVAVIQFNSSWNSDNNFDITVLKDCEIDSVIICNEPELKDEHKIKSVPTVIIFDEGDEVIRFEANIMMQIEATRKEIQKAIDNIYLEKFE